MKVTKAQLPTISELYKIDFDFVDSYQGTYFDPDDTITSRIIGKAFFTSAPGWTAKLFALRNRIVTLFGLKTSGNAKDKDTLLANFKCEPKERLGLFQVYAVSEDEVILGEDDKHLNFRISLLKGVASGSNPAQKRLTISTTVQFNNWFGKCYFFPVKPFHQLIVPRMLKGIIRQIED